MISIFIPFLKQDGFSIFLNVLVKSYLSCLCLILLSSTTDFSCLLKGLEKLYVPKIIIMILSFMYRYIFVLVDELMRILRAANARNFSGGMLYKIKVIGSIIGILFLRSFERGERIYLAMISRGFDGKIRTINILSFKRIDFAFFFLTLSFLILIRWW
jgi:cobalt/nickel transport system permease protein